MISEGIVAHAVVEQDCTFVLRDSSAAVAHYPTDILGLILAMEQVEGQFTDLQTVEYIQL